MVGRRIAAILVADLVGCSRLMTADEAGTLVALENHRSEFFDPTMTKNGGRLFREMGDGFLVEFGSWRCPPHWSAFPMIPGSGCAGAPDYQGLAVAVAR